MSSVHVDEIGRRRADGGDAATARARRAIDILRAGFSARDCASMHGDVRSNVDEEVLDDDAEHAERKEGVVYLFPK